MSSVRKTSGSNVTFSKGLIIAFFTIFLIIYGIFITNFIEDYPLHNIGEYLPVFVNYLPLVCYIGAIFLGFGLVIFIRNTTIQKSREIQSRKKIKTRSYYKEALFLVIFIFAFVPLFGPIFDHGKNDQNFSVYNDSWNGASDFKKTIEQEGYNVMNIQSSLSATERLDKSICLILLGPNTFYNPIFEIPYFLDFFSKESMNSILICHDHGSTSMLLWELFLASMLDTDIQGQIPVIIFPEDKGILRDNASYDTAPDFPIIKDFDSSHDTTDDINQVILSEATAAVGGEFIEFFGWDLIGQTTDYGYVDINGDHMFSYEEDSFDFSSIAGILGFTNTNITFGTMAQPVFLAKETGSGRVFVSADASLFNNELINHPSYDNRQFGINIINWLTYGGVNKDEWVIAFDELHIRPELSRDLTSAGIFGFIMQYVIHLSTNPITAWAYPLLAIFMLKKYLPKKDEKKEKKKAKEQETQEERERFRTSSFFAEKIEWYREKSRYGKALTLLYRRLERKLNALLGGRKITTQNVTAMVIAKDPKITKLKTRRIAKFMDRIIAIKEGRSKIKNEQDFETLFFEMEWVVNNI